jgi:hypothetical protein
MLFSYQDLLEVLTLPLQSRRPRWRHVESFAEQTALQPAANHARWLSNLDSPLLGFVVEFDM